MNTGGGLGVDLRVLGPVEAHLNGETVQLGPRRQRFILAVLALEVNRVVSVARLVGLSWSMSPPRTAAQAIQVCISRLRTVLASNAGIAVSRHGTGYILRADPAMIDAHRFRTLLGRAMEATTDETRIDLLTAALAEWRGVALDDAATDDVRVRLCHDLDEARLSAVEDRTDALLRLGRHREVIGELATLIDSHPLRERATGQLMLALHRSGRTAEALARYRRFRDGLSGDLGLDPSAALRDLELAILRDDPEIATPARPPASGSVALSRGPAVPAQLPPEIPGFIGRAGELTHLDALLDSGGGMLLGLISGSPGIGKTALAVRWAHRVRERFPDGQLYVNLRGFDPRDSPVNPADALRGFLEALEVPLHRIPVDLAGRTARYRSLTAHRRLLIVLDNASGSDQVRPLLPGSSGCAVLVTSRNRLAGLVAGEGAYPVQLGVLPAREARDLLAARLGERRIAGAGPAVAAIIDYCAGLPLALAIVAARGATQPGLALDSLADELRDAGRTLDALDAGDGASADVRAVFSWSYGQLSDGAAGVFRLLGIAPGPDIGMAAATSLTHLSPGQLRPLLAELTRTHLVAEPIPGRFACHDLLRAYAAELAAELDPTEKLDAARRRVVDHYLHTARAANAAFVPPGQPERDKPPPPADGVRVEAFAGRREAMSAWFVAERTVLLATVDFAAAAGLDEHTWWIGKTISTFLHRQGHFADLISVQRAALAAATRLGDRRTQAASHTVLARALTSIDDYEAAYQQAHQALRLYTQLKDPAGLGLIHRHLGSLRERAGEYAEAIGHTKRAARYFWLAGDASGAAVAVNNLGTCLLNTGKYDEALLYCGQARETLRQIGFAYGEAAAADNIGQAYYFLGRHAEAIQEFHESLRLLGKESLIRATVHVHLADVQEAIGDLPAARQSRQEALRILDGAGHPDANAVRRCLSG